MRLRAAHALARSGADDGDSHAEISRGGIELVGAPIGTVEFRKSYFITAVEKASNNIQRVSANMLHLPSQDGPVSPFRHQSAFATIYFSSQHYLDYLLQVLPSNITCVDGVLDRWDAGLLEVTHAAIGLSPGALGGDGLIRLVRRRLRLPARDGGGGI